jgi:hypothetical protein
MVHAAEHLLGAEYLTPVGLEAFQGNGPGTLVQENAVNIDKVCVIVLTFDQMFIPQLVKKGARHWYRLVNQTLSNVILLYHYIYESLPVMSNVSQPGPVICCVLITADLNACVDAYCDWLFQTVTSRFTLDGASARAIGYPELAGTTAASLANRRGREWLLMLEASSATPRNPLSTHGWLAQEILVEDVDSLVKSLADSPFTVLRPPADLDVSDRIRASQVRGPAGEILYLTQVKGPVPPFELPHCEAAVDHLFIPVLSTPDRDASLGDYAALGANEGMRFDTRISVVNQELGLPLEQRHPVATLQLRGPALIEIDHITAATPAPAALCLGTACIVFESELNSGADAICPTRGPFAGLTLQTHRGSAGERFAFAARRQNSHNH